MIRLIWLAVQFCVCARIKRAPNHSDCLRRLWCAHVLQSLCWGRLDRPNLSTLGISYHNIADIWTSPWAPTWSGQSRIFSLVKLSIIVAPTPFLQLSSISTIYSDRDALNRNLLLSAVHKPLWSSFWTELAWASIWEGSKRAIERYIPDRHRFVGIEGEDIESSSQRAFRIKFRDKVSISISEFGTVKGGNVLPS